MRIELEDGQDDDLDIDTDEAERDELVEACIRMHTDYDKLDKAWDKLAAALEANGLDFRDTDKRAILDMVDPDTAFVGFKRMLTEFIEDQIERKRGD